MHSSKYGIVASFIHLRALVSGISVQKSVSNVGAQEWSGGSVRLKRLPHLIFNEAGSNFISLPFFEASVRIVHASWVTLKPRCQTGLIGGGRWDCWYLTDKLISDFGFISCHFIGWRAWWAASSQRQKARSTVASTDGEAVFLITLVPLRPRNDDRRWRGQGQWGTPVLGLLGLHICNPAKVMTSSLAKQIWH